MTGLSARLTQIADFVPIGSVVADIGTDHGFLAIHLIDTGRSPRVVGSDINTGPYHIARRAILSRGLEKQIELRLGDGLKVLTLGEVDVVVLAGMGGHTICDVLTAGQPVLAAIKRLVLQPMRDVVLVRRWLWEHGWGLADEELVHEDRHYYVILAAEPGQEKNDDDFILEVGPRLLEKRGQLLYDYLIRRYLDLGSVMMQLQNSHSPEGREKAAQVGRELKKIKEVLGNW